MEFVDFEWFLGLEFWIVGEEVVLGGVYVELEENVCCWSSDAGGSLW